MSGKLAFVALLAFLLIIPLAAAKNVVFITGNDACHLGDCSCLGTEERAFCDRIETGLGYNLTIIGESYVIANHSTEWWAWAQGANLVFLGDTSQRTASVSADRGRFCGNVSIVTPSRKVFATFGNAYKNGTNTLGCAFGPPLAIADWTAATNNSCGAVASPSNFRKLADAYITSGLPVVPALYTANAPVKMHGPDSPLALIGLACSAPTGVFAVLNVTDRGAFWGLDRPSLFTADTWTLFDRTVWEVLNETTWNITPNIIPSIMTANGSMLVVAKATERGQLIGPANTMNFTLDARSGGLAYASGYWTNSSTVLPAIGIYALNVTGWDAYRLRGSATQGLVVGNTTITILSADYVPGENYTIIASATNGTEFQSATVYYSIWNATDWTRLIANQPMARPDSYYTAVVLGSETSRWREPLVLEVVAINNTLYNGGSYKWIMLASALTGSLGADKAIYKPGETVNLALTTAHPPNVTAANLTLIDPNGTATPLGAMTRLNNTLWRLNYTLPLGSLAGSHTFNASFTDGIRTNSAALGIAVKPYDVYFTKNKAVYSTGETVALWVQISNPYTAAINFTVAAAITDPAGNTSSIGNGTISGAGSWNASWPIAATAAGGEYAINVTITDNINPARVATRADTFTVNATAYISVTPLAWSLNATSARRYTQTFVLNNTGAVDLANITITPSVKIEDFVEVSPAGFDSLARGNSTNFTAGWNASGPISLSGTMAIAAAGQPLLASIPVKLSLSAAAGPPPTQNWLSVDPAALVNTTVVGTGWEAAFTLSNSGTEEVTGIMVDVAEGLAGLLSVSEKPDTIPAGGSATLKLAVDTTAAAEGSHAGTITVSSSGGTAEIAVNIKIVGDLSAEADTLTSELDALSANMSALAAKGKNVSAASSLAGSAADSIAAARTAWDAGDYATADAKIEEAQGTISSIRSQLTALATAPVPPGKAGGVIWAVAIVIIIAIAGMTALKFKAQLKELLDKLLKRKPKVPPEEYREYPPAEGERAPPAEEEAPPGEEREERYRTEWY